MVEGIEPYGWYFKAEAKKSTKSIHPIWARGLVKGVEYEDFSLEEPEESESLEIKEKHPLYTEEQVEELLSK